MSDFSRKKLYSRDGVDVEEEANFSSFAGSICRQSYQNSPFVKIHDFSKGHFRGPRPFTLKNLPSDSLIEASTDGIGTKGILIDAAKTHHLAAYDIIAMTASDITRFGGLPLVFVNVLDLVAVAEPRTPARKTYIRLIEGLGRVAKEAGIVLLKGETAQMGVALGSELSESKAKFNWSGTMIGAYHKNKMITGESLKAGQVIIALKENGFRCNGISSVRKAFKEKFGNEWWQNPAALKYIKAAASPSLLYDRYLNTLHGWFDKKFKPLVKIHALIHLSGGALKEKLAKDILFEKNLSATLDNLWEPPMIMRQCANWRGLNDEEFYETWNGGQGMLMIVDAKDAKYCLTKAKTFNIKARVAGSIIKTKIPTVVINSRFTLGKQVVYTAQVCLNHPI